MLLLAAAAAVIVVDGMRGLAFILGPSFLALVLVIVVYPVQANLVRRGAPGWVGLMTGFVGVTVIVVAIGGSVFLAMARFASILPEYSDEAQKRLDSLMSKLDSLGIHTDQQKAMSEALDPSRLAAVLGDVLSGLASLSSSLFFLITVLLFMTLDAFGFPAQLQAARSSHPAVVDALVGFAHGTRTYLVVSTIFGFIVAVIDTIVLAMIGVPAAVAWGVLAFVTNYIPNIGFVIGLIPPALLALLDGGRSEMLLVIAAYSIINFIIQSLIQPKFVADAVGHLPHADHHLALLLGLCARSPRCAPRHPSQPAHEGAPGRLRPPSRVVASADRGLVRTSASGARPAGTNLNVTRPDLRLAAPRTADHVE